MEDGGGDGGGALGDHVVVGRRAAGAEHHFEAFVGGEVEGVRRSGAGHHRPHAAERPADAFVAHHRQTRRQKAALHLRRLLHQTLQSSLPTINTHTQNQVNSRKTYYNPLQSIKAPETRKKSQLTGIKPGKICYNQAKFIYFQ